MKLVSSVRSPLRQVRAFHPSAKLFLLATLMDGVVYSAWTLFFNFYILERGFDRQFLGLVNAMPAVGALVLGIPLGVLSDRIGRKISMLLGIGCAIVGMGLEVTVLDPVLILVTAFIAGLGTMLYYISQAPFMMKVSNNENRALLFSLNFGLVTLAGAAGNIFAGQLPSLFGGWLHVSPRSPQAYQAVLLSAVALSLLSLIPLVVLREPSSPQPDPEKPPSPFWKIVFHPVTMKLSLPNLLIGLGAAVLMPYMNVFFYERFSLPDQSLGWLFGVAALMTGVGSVVGPRLANRLGGKIRAVVFTQSASLVFLLMTGFTPWLDLVFFSFLMRSVLMNMSVPLYHTFAMEQVVESEQGTVNSVLEWSWQFGWMIGPYISGVVQQFYGFSPLFIATAITYGLANVVTWVYFQQHDHEGLTLSSRTMGV